MKNVKLGNTNIDVSRLCFGSLTISPLQRNFSYKEGAKLIRYAFDRGINFLDTAELYDNYGHINLFLKDIDRKDFVIATKSYSYSKETAENSLMKALNELGTDYIDLFLLHEQESEHTIKGHYEAIEYFIKAKEKGIIRSIGISTHRVEGVLAAAKYNEIEVVHPIINKIGIGIQDGDSNDMINAIKKCHALGKGIYGMKPLGGGHLLKNVEEAFNYVQDIKEIHSIAIGMQSHLEVDANVNLIEKRTINKDIEKKLRKSNRKLHIADWCVGCGRCQEICRHNAIKIVNGKAQVDKNKCVLCGYCGRYCNEFCIKII
ncbi:aldo/keto reductase [Clostridium sp. D2Q-14]|uniref:aldo/keto reductase n=1 Tax=Anaeromonas gelatinilytica TaxID=2683194 RepID=UPI00193BB8B3|nr:aldo/keto reductase [Anaeromonas gelatinilytica]MBS4535372.1 aldo/keto reductase [Anaeromonas gelatinilytica]